MSKRSGFMDLTLFRRKTNASHNLASFISKRAHTHRRRKHGTFLEHRFPKNDPRDASESKGFTATEQISNESVVSFHDVKRHEDQSEVCVVESTTCSSCSEIQTDHL